MQITLPSGKKKNYTRPPRFVFWRHGRIGQTFQAKMNEVANSNKSLPADQHGLLLLESLSEDEARRFQAFTDDLVRHATGDDPNTFDELDYFTIVGKALYSTPGAKVETEEGETDVESVENFPAESDVPAVREDVPHVPGMSIHAHGAG